MTTKKKIVFVVNPISGTQGKRAILKWIDERINRTLYDYTIVKTQYAGHAEKIAATAAKEKVDIVVAIGGDGTINEIGRALIHTDTALYLADRETDWHGIYKFLWSPRLLLTL